MFRKFVWIFLVLGFLLFFVSNIAFAGEELDSLSLGHYIMAIVYDDLGDVDRAIQEYKKAIRSDDQLGVIHLNLAASLIKNNELSKAQEELNLAVKLSPDSAQPHAILAILYLIQDKIDLAAGEYEIALKNASQLNPQDTDIYKSLGKLYLKQNKLKEAESTYSLIASLTPDDPEVHFYLGSIYSELKEDALCEKELRRSLELNPNYCPALNFLGYEYVEKNRNFKEAERLIKRALRFEPDNGVFLDSLGWLYFKLGKFKEAKRNLEKAASLMPDPLIYEHLGDLYYKVKDFNKAGLTWQKALDLNPRQDSLKKKIENLKKNVGSAK